MTETRFAIEILMIFVATGYGGVSLIVIWSFIHKTFSRSTVPKKLAAMLWFISFLLMWAGFVIYEILRVVTFLFDVELVKL